MKIIYKDTYVGDLGRSSQEYIFTIKTKKMHKTYTFKAKNDYEAQFKCDEICKELENNNSYGRK